MQGVGHILSGEMDKGRIWQRRIRRVGGSQLNKEGGKRERNGGRGGGMGHWGMGHLERSTRERSKDPEDWAFSLNWLL